MTFRMVFLISDSYYTGFLNEDFLMFSSTNILFKTKCEIPAKKEGFCK